MNTLSVTHSDKRHRSPAEIISHGIWLYFRCCLSYRDVEALMAKCGSILTYEAVRYWCRKLGRAYAHQLPRWRLKCRDIWHQDEVFLTIHGERRYLWQAVDQHDHVLDISVQRQRTRYRPRNASVSC